MGNFTNNRGYKIDCCACRQKKTENYNLEGYFTFTPPFANAIDSVNYGYCNIHKADVQQIYDKAVSESQNFLSITSDT
jgi:hypothetical protein